MIKRRVLIVGGKFGVYGHAAAFSMCPSAEVIGVLGSTPEKTSSLSKSIGRKFIARNPEEAFAQADVISFALPPEEQVRLFPLAVKLKKDIILDKPVSVTLAQAKKMKQICRKSKIRTCVNFEFPELQTFKRVKSLIENNRLGKPIHFFVDWRIESSVFKTGILDWKSDPKKGGGMWLHYFAHSIHLVHWFFGGIRKSEIEVFDSKFGKSTLITGKILTKSGVMGTLAGTPVAKSGLGHRIEIHFEKGSVILANSSNDPIKPFELSIFETSPTGIKSETFYEKDNFSIEAMKLDSRAYAMAKLFERFLLGAEVPTLSDGLMTQKILNSVRPKKSI